MSTEVDVGSWSPTTEMRTDEVTARSAGALHGLLDGVGAPPGPGDPIPPLWHWLAFLPSAPQEQLGPDGHPRASGLLPPIDLAHRMYARGNITVDSALTIGSTLERRSCVTSITKKSGRTGELVFVEVTHEISGVGAGSVIDVQDLVYRGKVTSPPKSAPESESAPSATKEWLWRRELRIDATLLFRFSALTYNAHRIHYDYNYATKVEGYPDLVVHGPLQAVALLELCRRHIPERDVVNIEFIAKRPAFDGAPLHLRGRWMDDDAVELEAVDQSGVASMTCVVTMRSVG